MKLTVLCDNNTLIDRYYLAEPALSFYIEDAGKRILFDTGYSDVFKLNAEKMGIDLTRLDAVVLSHKHNDHTGGLRYIRDLSCSLYCHPGCIDKAVCGGSDISMPIRLSETAFNAVFAAAPVKISEHLTFLAEIPRQWQSTQALEGDQLSEDTALACELKEGLFIITACSQSGIINICEYAKQLTGKRRIYGIIGGFHILNDEAMAREVAAYMKNENVELLCPCHCTDFQARCIINELVPIQEIGSGFSLDLSGQLPGKGL